MEATIILEFVSQFTEGYIWQKDPFELTFDKNSSFSCLKGKTRFGDNIEDEWFIVFILLEITKKFSEIIVK